MRLHSLKIESPSPKQIKRRSNTTQRQFSSIIFKSLNPKHIPLSVTKLEDLRKRNLMPAQRVAPPLAHLVIKTYIIPLFTEDNKHKLTKSRSNAFGFKNSASHNNPQKLSDQLTQSLKQTQIDLANILSKLSKTLAETESLKTTLDSTQKSLINSSSHVKMSGLSLDCHKRQKKREDFQATFALKEKLELNNLISEAQHRKCEHVTELDKLIRENAHILETSELFYHKHLSLNMKSVIVGERLKGAYEAFILLLTSSSIEDRLLSLLRHWQELAYKWYLEDSKNIDLAYIIYPEIMNLIKGSNASFQERSSIISELKRLKNVILSKITNFSATITSSDEESSFLLKSHSLLSAKLQNFNEEYQRTRYKLSEIIAINSTDHLNSEKICEACSATYTEKNNFNWSCKTHSSVWSGSMYWCCGNTIKDSTGCQKSKHKCKEDDGEIEEIREKKKNERSACGICKKIGHRSTECEFDPNFKGRDAERKPARASPKLIQSVFQRQKKAFKLIRLEENIGELKDSMIRAGSEEKVKKQKKSRVGGKKITISAASTPVGEETGYEFEFFPRIHRRRAFKPLS